MTVTWYLGTALCLGDAGRDGCSQHKRPDVVTATHQSARQTRNTGPSAWPGAELEKVPELTVLSSGRMWREKIGEKLEERRSAQNKSYFFFSCPSLFLYLWISSLNVSLSLSLSCVGVCSCFSYNLFFCMSLLFFFSFQLFHLFLYYPMILTGKKKLRYILYFYICVYIFYICIYVYCICGIDFMVHHLIYRNRLEAYHLLLSLRNLIKLNQATFDGCAVLGAVFSAVSAGQDSPSLQSQAGLLFF